jgi:hypothetical protein
MLPDDVVEQRVQSLLKIPDKKKYLLLPQEDLTASEFLEFQFPPQSSDIAFASLAGCFSEAPPSDNIDSLSRRRILSGAALDAAFTALRASVREARAVLSFVDPQYKQAALPIWVLSFMRQATYGRKMQEEYRRAHAWLKSNSALPASAAALAAFNTLTWGDHVKIYGMRHAPPISTLLRFLGNGTDGWMSDETIDMGIGFIQENMSASIRSEVIVWGWATPSECGGFCVQLRGTKQRLSHASSSYFAW